MAKGTRNKSNRASGVQAARASVVSKKQIPWGTIISVVAILALAGVVFGYYLVASAPKREQAAREEVAAEQFTPSAKNPDPSKAIDGVVIEQYRGSAHVPPTERVAYDQSPPFGGPHDGFWAACTGIVYPDAVRSENVVHSLEHGAVWIAYDPERISGAELDLLKVRVEGKPFMVMSPYPGLDQPISLQSWGHQLKLESASDERIDQFIVALRRNQNVFPEPRATCDALGPGAFDPDNPPPFDPTPPGRDAKPMDYQGNPNATPPDGS
ncbi:MAG: DUF3105 domain-containing protein [Haloechinothrix sp.]